MGKLSDEVFVCLDCETTGLDVNKDRIIEVAVVTFSLEKEFERFESLIDPQRTIPEDSIAIHHITKEMVSGQPKIEEVLPEIFAQIGDRIIVGHGIKFDIDLLCEAAKRAGIRQTIDKNLFIDTLRLARKYGDSPVNSLDRLRQHFNIASEGAHRAMSDVIVNIDVFRQLAKSYRTTNDMFDLLSKPILMKTMPLGEYKGRLMRDIPLDYLMRMAKRNYDQDLIFSIRSEIKRRKSGNVFQQATNPFSDL